MPLPIFLSKFFYRRRFPIPKLIKSFIFFIIIFTILICLFFIPIFESNCSYEFNNVSSDIFTINPNGFTWPIPGYSTISSNFGKRSAPTGGASTYHKGIDIPAPPGTTFIAVADGEITFTNFLGGGGYTITLSFGNFKVSYCHCDPNFIVCVGDKVKEGQIIGHVGPKNVYGVPGNQYKDSNGNPTNGATTGPHLHLGVRFNNEYENPLDYF